MASETNSRRLPSLKNLISFSTYCFRVNTGSNFFHFVTPEVVMVQHCLNEKCIPPSNKTSNVFVAAFTTAYARLKLLHELQKLQERVIYYDTDSIIYILKQGESPLPLGPYLGDLTDELSGDTIQEFASAGPKSYAYRTREHQKVVLKAKGIMQTFITSNQINFDSVAQLVEGYLGGERGRVLPTEQNTIRRDKRGSFSQTSNL